MNPFDLSGPPFLAFYVVVAIFVNSGSGQFFAREPIERAILSRCAQSGTAATAVLDDPAVEHACASYKTQLEQQQLMPDAGMRARRYGWFALAAALLLGIAAI